MFLRGLGGGAAHPGCLLRALVSPAPREAQIINWTGAKWVLNSWEVKVGTEVEADPGAGGRC